MIDFAHVFLLGGDGGLHLACLLYFGDDAQKFFSVDDHEANNSEDRSLEQEALYLRLWHFHLSICENGHWFCGFFDDLGWNDAGGVLGLDFEDVLVALLAATLNNKS